MSLNHSSDRYKEQRWREGGKFVCDSCGGEFPMSHLRRQRNYISNGMTTFVGVMCCYEPDGDSMARDLRSAYAAKWAAEKTARGAHPPMHDGIAYYGADQYDDPSALVSFTPSPIVLTRGGASVVVAMEGVGLTSADTWTYPSGITDAVPSVLNSSVSRTNTVRASALMSPGVYNLTFNGSLWPAAFSVR
jgi:hypothetical protein